MSEISQAALVLIGSTWMSWIVGFSFAKFFDSLQDIWNEWQASKQVQIYRDSNGEWKQLPPGWSFRSLPKESE